MLHPAFSDDCSRAPGPGRPLLDRLQPGALLVQLDRRRRRRRFHDAELLVQLRLHLAQRVGMCLEEAARVLTSLAVALAAVAEPGAAPPDAVTLHRQAEPVALARDA